MSEVNTTNSGSRQYIFSKTYSEKTSNIAAAIHRKASRAVTKHSFPRQQHIFFDHTPAREVKCLLILWTGKLDLKGIKEIASGGSG